MYKILLIDDEPLIRKGLLKIIDWDSLDCSIVDSLSNVTDAIDIISKEHIDIVISDIQMPGMTGLEFAKYVSENTPETKVILLTGYSDFTYAQAAVQYNVIDFILKPTNTENIIAAINKAKLSIMKTATNASKIKVLEQKMLSNNQKLQGTILNDIINGLMDINSISTKLSDVNVNLTNYYVLISQIKSDSSSSNTIECILDMLPLIFNNIDTYSLIINNSTLCTIVNSERFDKHQTEINNLCKEVITMLKNFKCCNISFGISLLTNSPLELLSAYSNASTALKYSFYDFKDENVFFFNKYKTVSLDPSTVNSYVNNIINHLNNIEFKQLISEVTTMFNTFKINRYDIDHIKHICILICSKCSDLLLNESMSFTDLIENPNIFTDILTCTSITTLNKLIENSIDITFYALNNKPHQTNSIVDKAKSYITKNYNDPNLTLNDIATHVHVSNAYLSRLFKEKTGETISELIIKIRISKAKDLLRNGSMKIYEIAYTIGIDDPAYFSQLFKKTTGLSPKEYKYNH